MTSTALQKNLSSRLAEFYARIDEVDISHENELVLLEFRKEDLIQRMADWDAPSRWKDLHEAFESFTNYRDLYDQMGRASDLRKMESALSTLAEIIAGGYIYEYMSWREIRDVAEQIRKTKDSEISRRQKAAEMITEKQVMLMIGYMLNSVQTNVSNEEERRRVLEDLKRINIKP